VGLALIFTQGYANFFQIRDRTTFVVPDVYSVKQCFKLNISIIRMLKH